MAPTPEEVNDKFMTVVMKRSGGGILGLARNFKIIDRNGSGSLDQKEFAVAMTKFRIGLTKEETKVLFAFYDKDDSGTVEFTEFLKSLRSKLSEQRRELTEQAFDAMDVDGSGEINFDDLKDKYDVSRHPKVIQGEWTKKQAIDEFIKIFEGDEGNKDGVVTKEEWMDYHAGLSSNIDTDDAFGMMMARNWGIEFIPQAKLDQLMETIRSKCKSKGNNPKKVALDTFKFFDTNNSKTISYDEFEKAMEKFSGGLNPLELKTFFGIFDHDNSGEIEYDELVATVFPDKK